MLRNIEFKFCIAGEILFKIHADELKVEVQNLLYELAREQMPLWKQMRALEVTSAIVAETLIEMGVLIISDPAEIHWPNGTISKPVAGPRGRKGKKTQKNRHGIFGDLVSSFVPPTIEKNKPAGKSSASTSGGKRFKAPLKSTTVQSESQEANGGNEDRLDEPSNPLHQGLPVQGRRGIVLS